MVFGASQQGLRDGTANTDRFRNYFPDTVEEMVGKLDELGGPSTDPHYPMACRYYFLGDVTLMIDGNEVGSLKGIKSAGRYSAVTGYGLVTGRKPNTSVTHQYEIPFEFTGKLENATIVVKK